ncbi:MAG: hypothetical protein ACNI25_08505 [Halarcobacter sp.]
MQVSNNTYTNYYTQTNNITKTEKTEENSFSSMLTSSEKTEEKEEVGLYIKYMDQFNYFDSLSPEDRKLFREILKDDQITMAEMDSLTYEQAEKFEYIAYPQGDFTKEQINNTPIVYKTNQIGDMLLATRTTNDKTFNEALYRTARELDDDIYRMTVLGQVKMNVAQAHFGYELMPSFYVEAETENMWKWDYDNMNIDFNKFLGDVISMHKEALANPKTHPKVIDQHQERLDGYNIILKHYNDIKKESMYA